MKLRIGDKVRFLNEVGEGQISRIKDQDSVYVEMPDGFEIPYLIKHLVPIHTEMIIDRDNENIELNPDAHLTDAIYFIIEPDHDFPPLMNEYKVHLFNASSYNLVYTYSIKDEDHFQTIKHGEVGAYQKVLLKQVKLHYFNEYHYHKIECLLFKNTYFKAQHPISEVVHITSEGLKKTQPIKHEEFKYPVYGFVLKEEFLTVEKVDPELSLIDIEKLKSIKEFKSKQKTSKSKKEYLKSLEKEVDLHINELVESTSGLSNFEMLNIQLETFEKELDEAIEKGLKKITFIHGVGNGRLKQEIIAALKKTPGVDYQDASFKEYGYGATQVNIF